MTDATDRFDHAAALGAALACEQLAATMRSCAQQREAASAVAGNGWEGPHHQQFVERRRRLTARDAASEAALRALARSIRDAAHEATARRAAQLEADAPAP